MDDVDDATAHWLIEEAGRREVSVETVARQRLQRGLEWERRRAELPTYHAITREYTICHTIGPGKLHLPSPSP